ncbi:MAG: alkaline phosphatase family protein, partial [Thaumarchaeota archaeon]|nr:alkaline phosphatase family protein [Nitrososphaerota archaeon]
MTVFLFGLDGASEEQIRSVMQRTNLPNFEKVFKKGIISDLLSVYPYVTAPAWTTIFSGVNPGKHGIFEMYKIVGNKLRPQNMRDTDVPFLWDYLSWAGKRTLALGIPFIYPAPTINGVFVTGRFVPKLSSYPGVVKDQFDLSGFEYVELPTEQGIENVISRGPKETSEKALEGLKLRIKGSLALIDSEKWDIVILVDNLPDEVFHISYDDPHIVGRMFSRIDDFLGKVFERLDKD